MHCSCCYLYFILKYTILESAEGFREENYSATRVTREAVVRVDSLMSRCRVLRSSSRRGLTSRWPYLRMRCRTMMCWTNLRNSAYETLGSNCRVANLKKMFNKFVQQIQFRRARWDGGWVVVTEYKYKSGSTIEICRICRYQKRDSSKHQREMLKTTEYCVCVLKMECRIRDETKINKYYVKTLLTSTFNSIHVRQPLNI